MITKRFAASRRLPVRLRASSSAAERLEDRRLLAATVPSGFQYADFVTGLPESTSMTWTPDGRLFYTEKGGAVRVVKNGVIQPNSVVRVAVDEYFERGLECITLDPNFATNGVFYLYYTKRDPSNPNTVPNNAKNRISRFQMDPANPDRALAGSEQVVLDNIPSDSGYHNGGAMVFGADGYMYVGCGEVGQPDLTQSTQRAQDLSTVAGKILRINPRAGAQLIPSDNPFVGQTGKRGEIYAYGMRNPFTMAVKPGTNTVYVNDVGSYIAEEIDQVVKGANYGFPNSEGYTTNSAYTSPVYAYTHTSTGNANGQAAITGGTFYTGNKFPSQYQGKYFFADYVNHFIRVFDPAVPRQATTFATNTNSLIDLDVGPDGNLYALKHTVGDTNGTIVKISYVGSGNNRNPDAVATANKTSGPLPLTVNFDGSGSSDPDGDALTYSWNFGDGATGTGKTVSHIYTTKGIYNAVLTVSDGKGGTDASDPIKLSPGNDGPVITFTSPANNSLYSGDETISYGATATDTEDGTIPASKYDWTVVLHHQTHEHPFLSDIDGTTGGTFKIPVDVEVDPVQFYRIQLTVTDSAGVQTTNFVDIKPRTSTFTLASNVAGVTLTLDGQSKTAGTQTLGVVGTRRRIDAPQFQTVNGTTYEFVGWSDSGARFHDIFTPAQDTTYTATYQVATTAVTTRRAAADAYVRDGSSAGANFGNTTDLVVKKSATSGNTRETYLRFDVSDFANVAGATLRLFGASTVSTQGVPLAVYGASNITWSETGINWNNKPAADATALASKTISGTSGQWNEFDVSNYVQQQRAAGATAVTFVVRATSTTDAQAVFNSDENAANKPELLVRAPVSQGLVVSPASLNVAEGGQSSFTVKLTQQPAADVVVTIARQSGDADLSADATTLTFTSADWNTAKTVTIAAAQDADAANGSAIFSISASGMPTQTVTATEQDDETPAGSVVLRAIADSYGRDGTYATQNFGSATELQLKKGSSSSNREAFFKFDLSSLPTIGNAKLRVYGRVDSATDHPVVSVYRSNDVGWAENTVTWNTRPLATGTPLAQVTLTPGSTAAKYYEFDVTSFLQQEKQAGHAQVTLVLRSETATTPYLIFTSDEATSNRPELVVTTSGGPIDPPPPGPGVPSVLASTGDTYVRDGSSADLNFGTAGELQLKKSGAGSNREIWLKFDLTSVSTVSAAKLRIFGRIDSSTESPSVGVYSADSSWSESSLTWNNRPAAATSALATTTIATSTSKYYEWDVTSFLAGEKAAGRNVVTLVLRSLTSTTPYVIFSSDEAGANQPQLVVTA